MDNNHPPSDALGFFPNIKNCFRAGDIAGYQKNIQGALNVVHQVDWQKKENSATATLLIPFALSSHAPQIATYILAQTAESIKSTENIFARVYPHLNKSVFTNTRLRGEESVEDGLMETLLPLEWEELSVFRDTLMNNAIVPQQGDDPLGNMALSWLRHEEDEPLPNTMERDLKEYMQWLYLIGSNPIQSYDYLANRHHTPVDFTHPVLELLREFKNEAEKGTILHELEVGRLSKTSPTPDIKTPLPSKKM